MCQADDLGSEEIVHLTPPEAAAMAPPPTLLLRRVSSATIDRMEGASTDERLQVSKPKEKSRPAVPPSAKALFLSIGSVGHVVATAVRFFIMTWGGLHWMSLWPFIPSS